MLKTITPSAGAALALLLAIQSAHGESRTLDWDQLSSTLASQTVSVPLPNGGRVKGKVISIDPQGMVLDVRKSTDPGSYPRGMDTIAREKIDTLEWQHSTKRWRIIGTTVGAAAAVPAGVVVAVDRDGIFGPKHGGTGLGIATMAGVTAAGFSIGWAADRHKTTITLRR